MHSAGVDPVDPVEEWGFDTTRIPDTARYPCRVHKPPVRFNPTSSVKVAAIGHEEIMLGEAKLQGLQHSGKIGL